MLWSFPSNSVSREGPRHISWTWYVASRVGIQTLLSRVESAQNLTAILWASTVTSYFKMRKQVQRGLVTYSPHFKLLVRRERLSSGNWTSPQLHCLGPLVYKASVFGLYPGKTLCLIYLIHCWICFILDAPCAEFRHFFRDVQIHELWSTHRGECARNPWLPVSTSS